MPTTEQQIKEIHTTIKATNKSNHEKIAQYVKEVQAIFDSNTDSSQVAFKVLIENHLYNLSIINVKSPNKKKTHVQACKNKLMKEHFPKLLDRLYDLAHNHQDKNTSSNSYDEVSEHPKQYSDQSKPQLEKDETYILEEFFQSENGKKISELFNDGEGTEDDKQKLYKFIIDNISLFEDKHLLNPQKFEEILKPFFKSIIDNNEEFDLKFANFVKLSFRTKFIHIAESLYKDQTNIDLYRVELLCVLAYYGFIFPDALDRLPLYTDLKYKDGIQNILELEKKNFSGLSIDIDLKYQLLLSTFKTEKMQTNFISQLFSIALLTGTAYVISAPIQISILVVSTFLLIVNLYEQIQLNKRFFSLLREYAQMTINSDDMTFKTSYTQLFFNLFVTSMLLMAPSFLLFSIIANPTFLQFILIGVVGMGLLNINHSFCLNRYERSLKTHYDPLIENNHKKGIKNARREINTLKANYQQTYLSKTHQKNDSQSSTNGVSPSPSLFAPSNPTASTAFDNQTNAEDNNPLSTSGTQPMR